MRVDAQQPPWRVIRAFPREDRGVLVHLHNVSGGVLAGDDLRLNLELGAGTSALVTSTGATRLYRHRDGAQESRQEIDIQLASGALLEFLPDPLIPFANSRHTQHTSVSLADDAAFFWWETLAPGRQAMGEVFAYERLEIRNKLSTPAGPVLLENYILEPRLRPLTSHARLGHYTHMANFYACKTGLPQSRWLELEASLNELCRTRTRAGDTIWGAAALAADGVAVRGLSTSSLVLPETLTACWKLSRRLLTGKEAIPPRKVN